MIAGGGSDEGAVGRADDLTLRLADEGGLGAGEMAELRDLLADDEEARRKHVGLLRLEAALRGHRQTLGVADEVLDQIHRRRQERVVQGVLTQIQGRPASVTATGPASIRGLGAPARRWGARWALGSGAAAAALALLAFGLTRPKAPSHEGASAERRVPAQVAGAPIRTFATVVAHSGAASALRGGRVRPLAVASALYPGERVETGAASDVLIDRTGVATLRLGERTQVTLSDPGRLADRADRQGSDVHVSAGNVRADVQQQPATRAVVFATPHARATIMGTSLSLAVTARETRLAVHEGQVMFERLNDGSVVEVHAGQSALAVAEVTPPEAAQAPAGAGAGDGTVVFSHDFEDGELPSTIKQGLLTSGPCAGGSRFCAIGMMDPHDWRSLVVGAVGSSNVAYFSRDLVLSFDIRTDVRHILLQAWNPERNQNHYLRVKNATPGAWTHFEVRVADLVGERKRAWQEGDPIHNIRIHGGRTGGPNFHVDNLRLVDRPQTRGGSQ